MSRQAKFTYTAISLLTLIILGTTVTLLLTREPAVEDNEISTSITTRVTPTEGTTILINDKPVAEGVVGLEPGTYTVEVSRPGFTGETRQVDLRQGQNVLVAIILASNSAETANWYDQNSADASKASGIAGQLSEGTANAQVQSLPLLKRLPRNEPGRYSITYGNSEKTPENQSAVTIYIDYFLDSDKKAAENWIRYQGYRLENLDIVYGKKDI